MAIAHASRSGASVFWRKLPSNLTKINMTDSIYGYNFCHYVHYCRHGFDGLPDLESPPIPIMAARIRGASPRTTARPQNPDPLKKSRGRGRMRKRNGRQKGIPGWELTNIPTTADGNSAPATKIRPSSVAKPGGLLKQGKRVDACSSALLYHSMYGLSSNDHWVWG